MFDSMIKKYQNKKVMRTVMDFVGKSPETAMQMLFGYRVSGRFKGMYPAQIKSRVTEKLPSFTLGSGEQVESYVIVNGRDIAVDIMRQIVPGSSKVCVEHNLYDVDSVLAEIMRLSETKDVA